MNNRRAFSLVEIIVVVGIIALLAALLLVGLKYVTASASSKSTRTTLEAANALLGEYESARKLDTLLTGTVPAPQGSVAESGAARASELVALSGSAMNRFRTAPKVATLLEQLPAAVVTNWAALNPTVPPGHSNATDYFPGQRVLYGGDAYTCLERHTGRTPDASDRFWAIETASNPVLLDAWGNPLILVPGDGMVIFNNNGTPANFADDFDVDKDPNTAGVQPMVIRATSRRPFFASAGPDGVFQGPGPSDESVLNGAADNIYSFEN